MLGRYLHKAKSEENQPHIVRALISLGDFNQLYRQHEQASRFYKMAWEEAQHLPLNSEVRSLLNEPVPLPAFSYSQSREQIAPVKPTITIPLVLSIGTDGRVSTVKRAAEFEQSNGQFVRARRLVRRTLFRPAIIDGVAQPATAIAHHNEFMFEVDSN